MAKPKKIAIFYTGAKHWGGVETYIEKIFQKVDPNKLDLTLVSLGKWELGEKLKQQKYPVIFIHASWYSPLVPSNLAKVLKDGGFDLVTSQGMVANFFARVGSKLSGVPNLVTIHSDYKFDYQGYKQLLFRITFWLTKSFTSKYVVVSRFLLDETVGLGVTKDKIELVYNGVEAIAAQPKNTNNQLVFGSLGRLHYKKGYHLLVQAVKILAYPNIKVYIWGDGEEKDQLTEQIRLAGLENQVVLKGFTKNIGGSLAEVDYYIQPSLEEGFGITVAEAMYAQKPVIVTPAGSLPELIQDGKTGIIASAVTPESIAVAMKTLIENRDLADKLAVNARKYALANFGIETWIKKLTEVYLGASK